MRKPGKDRSGFWLQLGLQTIALVTAANANELVERQPLKAHADDWFVAFDAKEDVFLYNGRLSPPAPDVDFYESQSYGAATDFNRPALMTQADLDLLGGLDYLDGGGADDDWLFN